MEQKRIDEAFEECGINNIPFESEALKRKMIALLKYIFHTGYSIGFYDAIYDAQELILKETK